jgi:hypothetical protein
LAREAEAKIKSDHGPKKIFRTAQSEEVNLIGRLIPKLKAGG